jgi:RsiW-degrading membrane proteinase PrsW (M82 family)
MDWVFAAGAVAAGAVFWSVYFRLKDRLKPEPFKLVASAVLLGGVAAGAAMAVFRLLPAFGVPSGPTPEDLPALLLYCVAVIGVVEEGLKFAVVRLFMVRWREYDEVIDGLVYAALTAIGFAAVENLVYARGAPGIEVLARAAALPLTHAVFSAVWGLPMAHALSIPRPAASRFLRQAAPLALSMGLHGAYDFFLLGFNATFTASAIVLVLWIALIYSAGRLEKEARRSRLKA